MTPIPEQTMQARRATTLARRIGGAVTLLALAAAGVAQAQAQPKEPEPPRQRADVIAEFHAARASGEVPALTEEDSGSAWLSRQAWRSTLSRTQVLAELRRARQTGELDAMVAEDSGSAWLAARRDDQARRVAEPRPADSTDTMAQARTGR